MRTLVYILSALTFVTSAQAALYDDFEGAYQWYEVEPSGRTGSNQIVIPPEGVGAISPTHVLEIIADGPDESGYDYAAQVRVPLFDFGSTIDVSAWIWDDSLGVNPSIRLWGHWEDSFGAYLSSAGGSTTYSAGTGWELMSYSWDATTAPVEAEYFSLELRVYGVGLHYADNVSITPEPGSLLLLGLAGLLVRRR